MLRGDQIAENVPGFVKRAQRQQPAGAFDQIARPNEVIAADVVARIAPGNAEACNHCAGEGLVLMDAEHHRGRRNLVLHRPR